MAGFTVNGFGAADSYYLLKPIGTFYCPKCGKERSYALMELRMKVRLLFIPTVTVNKKYAIVCEKCKTGYYVEESVKNDILAGRIQPIVQADGVQLRRVGSQQVPPIPQPNPQPASQPQPNVTNAANQGNVSPQLLEYYTKAADHMAKGEYDQELHVLTQALSVEPNSSTTWVKLGRCYRALGHNDKALEAYQFAISLNPAEGSAYSNMGTLCILKQDWTTAASYYEKGLPLIDKNTSDYWVAYANYAVAIAKLGNIPQAAAMINEAEIHGYANAANCRAIAGIL